MSTIAVFGATGYAGKHIVSEALDRGHTVISVSRGPNSDPRSGVTARQGSLYDPAVLNEVAAAADVVVLAVPAYVEGGPTLLDGIPAVLDAAAAHGNRLGVVGGAGSLTVSDDGPRLVDTPDFPAFALAEAGTHATVLDAIRASTVDVDWFYVSPSLAFGAHAPGERTGEFRLGTDTLLADAQGNSAISGADYAIAFIDEIDKPAHHRTRFTVGY